MKKIVKKLFTLIITLFCISFLTFTAFSIIPGDAAVNRLGKEATQEQVEAIGPYATSHQNTIDVGWARTQAMK